jgi:nucleoside-diphosphate-sugar epimerase
VTRVLVTGAGGFVGRAAVPVLQDAGCEVVPARTDLLAPDGPRAAVAQAEATHLLHLAWETEHGAYWDSADNERWLTASLELLAQFARAGGERAVTVGTCAEYDWTSGGVLAEDAPCAPATAYGRAKLELGQRAEDAGPRCAHARLFFPYGPGEDRRRLVPSVITAVLTGTEAPISSGDQVRDFVAVSDVGAAVAALVAADVTGPVNVGSGEGVAVRELARLAARLAGDEDLLRVGALPDRPGEPAELVADVSRLRAATDWAPRASLRDGISRAVEWWKRAA